MAFTAARHADRVRLELRRDPCRILDRVHDPGPDRLDGDSAVFGQLTDMAVDQRARGRRSERV